MKAMVLTAPGVLEYLDVPDAQIASDDEILLRVGAASVCGSDIHGFTGAGGRRVPPLIMGHEAAGEVIAVGDAVTDVRLGERVFMLPQRSCLRCAACLDSAYDACTDRKVYGADLPGAFAEFIKVAGRNAIALPDSVSYLQASLIEPMSVVIKGVSRAQIRPGDTAAVIGAGPIGLLAVALLAQYGLRELIVVEPHAGRRALALELGASTGLDPAAEDVAGRILGLTGERGVDVALEAVGVTATVRAAVDAARPGGQIVWLGNAGRIVEIDEFKVVWNQLTIHASMGVSREAAERAIQLIAAGRLPVERIVSLRAPLSEGPTAFLRTAEDPSIIKTVLVPGQ